MDPTVTWYKRERERKREDIERETRRGEAVQNQAQRETYRQTPRERHYFLCFSFISTTYLPIYLYLALSLLQRSPRFGVPFSSPPRFSDSGKEKERENSKKNKLFCW